MEYRTRNYGISVGWRSGAGLLSVWGKKYCLHFAVQRRHSQWGFSETWYDGPWYSWGIGPFALICWQPDD